MSSLLARRARPRRTAVCRRRLLLIVALALAAGLAVVLSMGPLENAIREVTLPLRHDDIIRQQWDKDVDAALIAAVIYEESKFRDQTCAARAG